jgi:hypothetical protein
MKNITTVGLESREDKEEKALTVTTKGVKDLDIKGVVDGDGKEQSGETKEVAEGDTERSKEKDVEGDTKGGGDTEEKVTEVDAKVGKEKGVKGDAEGGGNIETAVAAGSKHVRDDYNDGWGRNRDVPAPAHPNMTKGSWKFERRMHAVPIPDWVKNSM